MQRRTQPTLPKCNVQLAGVVVVDAGHVTGYALELAELLSAPLARFVDRIAKGSANEKSYRLEDCLPIGRFTYLDPRKLIGTLYI